ncbi:MAG: PASTA domain-containing protein [Chlorobi bacterium]|uniref:Penicillin-binding transpeptidase domain-containing protein n=1 Tax=Chryseobacterium gambrini TaxID=373672 RepID=A0AAJ1R4G5_9FLAO|nr:MULTISPECIES: penicillin-binding transpeptidase domain-containing protein [Chryseobacterium]MDN4012144.1 penicillin-binding transpeptidase domain-containing protein [Chryseobacterium gambrini]MDN4029662.1 penicillin-binding transpeptidase domain-containing protein [Chryseobacterium gambrini]NPA07951.1 PASTA domain-containing protein [Chlorobiota bacterium]QWA37088.1 PASTA domain-containing protein [Chryseobacterium sp. ZHDP1]
MQKQNEYDNKRKKTLRWGYLFAVVALCVFVMFLARIVILQNTNVQEIKDDYINKNYREATLKAARGNLFASDGSILATTVMRYDIYLDFKTMKDTIYTNNIGALTDSLSKMFGKPRAEFRKKFDEQRKKKNQYYTLVKGLDFDQYDRIRKFPIFKKGKNKGGFIVDRNYKRELATSEIGAGTIGMDDGVHTAGLEGAFSKYLRGTDGKRLEQRINSSQWKPIDYWKVQEPVDGEDVYTTLDLRIQDIAHSALQKQLVNFEAKHGTVIVMETETGKVRAMVNLRRTDDGDYVDSYNYALKDNIEPGSTFKTISLLAAMDDGFIDENTTVNVGNGIWVYAKQRISDGHGGGTYDISDVLAKSSNVGSAKLITKYYAEKPQIFLDHLRRWKLFDKMNIELPGITKPKILTPESKRWNAATLASIAYGYSTNINLLQLATFYNGVANNGKMLKPLFIDKIMKDGKVMYTAKPEVMVNKMASEKAIKMMTNALTKAVEKGTAKSIFTPNLKMAGKTGTARFEYWLPGPMKYRSSFAGFYPADNPKYTCYVMISEPNTSKGFYGATVAAPVFKEIAGKTFLKTPQNIEREMLVDKKVNLNKMVEPNVKVAVNNKQMPNVVGLIGKNVIPQLENLGYRVDFKGVGRIKEQFPTEGTTISRNQRIYLSLQN